MPDTAPLARLTIASRGRSAAELVPILIFVGFALIPFAAAFGAQAYILDLFTRVMIFSIAALGLDLIVGYGALGAYAGGILAAHGVDEALVSLPVALVAATLFALATGAISLRTQGVYFIMITLAFGQMAYFTASSLAPYGGDDGLTIQARNAVAGFVLFNNHRTFYYIVLACLLGCS